MYPPERVLPKRISSVFQYRIKCNLILCWGGSHLQALKTVYCRCRHPGIAARIPIVIAINQMSINAKGSIHNIL